MFFTFLFLCTLISTCTSADPVTAKEKLVTSSLDANWAHTSLVAETSEFLSSDDPSAFWHFIESLIDDSSTEEDKPSDERRRDTGGTHESEFERAMENSASLLPPDTLALLRFALALRLHSPRVHLHRQIARDVLQAAEASGIAAERPKDFAHFYEINGAVGFSPTQLDALSTDALLESAKQRKPTTIYSVDHVYQGASTPKSAEVIAVLYADISKPDAQFRALHKRISRMATDGKLTYMLRHYDKNDQIPSSSVSLSGYGVELAIKSTEYKAIDDSNAQKADEDAAPTDLHGFNFSLLQDKYSHLRDNLRQFQLHLAELDELAPLKQWEIADIGLQAAQRVMDAEPEEALSQLTDLSQNFPIRARTLAKTKLRPSFRDEVAQNQKRWAEELDLAEGDSALFLNGMPIAMGDDVERLDMFQLFQTVRQEHQLAQAFAQMGYPRDYLSVLQAMELSEDKPNSYALDYRDGKPEWMNNLDKDKQYSDWGNSVRLLLQPYFPGMIRPIARNLFTMVCIVDPSQPASWPLIRIAFSLYTHQVALRIGFVFVVNDSTAANGNNDLAVALYNVYQFVKMEKDTAKAIFFLKKMIDELTSSDKSVAPSFDAIHAYFKNHYTDQEVEDVFGPNSDYDTGRKDGMAFFRRSGLRKVPALLVNGVPLDDSLLQSEDRVEEGILYSIMRKTGALQRAVMSGKLTDKENVQNWVLSQPDVLPRLNSRLLGDATDQSTSNKGPKITPPLYIAQETEEEKCNFAQTEVISGQQRTACVLNSMRYLRRADEDNFAEEPCWLTVWIIGDMGTPEGRTLLSNALKGLKKSNEMRLGVLHNGDDGKAIARFVDALLHGLSSTAAKQALHKLLTSEELIAELEKSGANPESMLDKIGSHGVNMDRVRAELKNSKGQQRRLHLQSDFIHNELRLQPGQRAVLVNGQLYGPLEADEQLEPEDFGLLERLAEKRGAKAVAQLVKQWREEGRKESDPQNTVFRMLAAVNAYAMRRKRQHVNIEMELESSLTLLADLEDDQRPMLEFTAIIDPLSRAAQKIAPVLQTLLGVVNADLRLAMNPKQRLSELPLKRFYRYVLREEPLFGPSGQLLPHIAQFRELPQKQLLTMNPIVPDAWMVQPVRAEYDLDNIRVASASNDIVAHFQLLHILLEGHCFEDQTGNPPRGLQFVLGTHADPALYDTIVMANLGYFQLKAGPGAWILRLREGRSKQIYELKQSQDAENFGRKLNAAEANETDDEQQFHVLVDSFSGRTIRVRVAKRKGMEKRSLLSEDKDGKPGEQEDIMDEEEEQDEEEDNSIWSNLNVVKRVKKMKSKLMGSGEKYDRINIFSLASGHLYERFLRIMMVSVMKNTRHPVKFWLLNNYLSPQFRETLPVMAAHYGFDYQLIEYKWPRWLHQQTEKQRVMWGYKILFLDVLFPLDVKKIIFVDADQIVRTDMMELMEHDLEGAPYGYTPFCNSRKSMDGFRFWRSGYWAQHLAGRRYHISALYVVDLVKFRQIAAGDRLRGQYQGLSSDPNSLANLDQDLPNNMIHQVRIHSLPQEWLWCETWCDDASKASAKTIDLCNNPQTKEPKLDSAVRIVSEWTNLDTEIKQLLADQQKDREAESGKRAEAEERTDTQRTKEKHAEL